MSITTIAKQGFQAAAIRAMTTIERVQTGVAFNPLDAGYKDDPYATYRKLHARDPFHRSRLANGWLLSRHADVSAVLRDPRFLNDQRKSPGYAKQRADMIRAGVVREDDGELGSMLTTDPPDHARLRGLVSRAFTPRTIAALRPRIEEIVDEHLTAVACDEGMDVISALAYPLPVIVIAEMLGIPIEDRERFKHWSDEAIRSIDISSTVEDMRRSNQAVRELRHYLEGIAAERRLDPREDLLSALLAAEEDGERLTIDEVYETVTLLLVAGNETTTNLIGNGLLALLRHPDQLAALRDDPGLIERAVEELLRYDSPVQATSRFPLEPVELAGHEIPPGESVLLLLGAANRDPDQFTDPDVLDIRREDNRHVAFGHGIHFCLGAPLARLEAQVAIPAILERFPKLRLASDRVEWRDNLILRGLKTLPVVF